MTMTCQECRNLLFDYTHGELDAAQDALVFAHVSTCDECRAARQAELDLTDSIRYHYAEERDLPMSVVAGVRQAMRTSPAPTFLDTMRAALRPAIIAPAAAAVLIIVGVLRFGPFHQPSPALSSSYFVRQHVAQTLGSPSSDRTWSAYLLTSENAKSAESSAP
jgi:anti-sigma factor RsiW